MANPIVIAFSLFCSVISAVVLLKQDDNHERMWSHRVAKFLIVIKLVSRDACSLSLVSNMATGFSQNISALLISCSVTSIRLIF